MQLSLHLTFTPAPPKDLIRPTTWLNGGWAVPLLGFTKKVEISQALSDALHAVPYADEDELDQRFYDALWLARHQFVLEPRPAFSFTLDFLHDDKIIGRMTSHSLRLHCEEKAQVILLGLIHDF